jgi:hypothetical protein
MVNVQKWAVEFLLNKGDPGKLLKNMYLVQNFQENKFVF